MGDLGKTFTHKTRGSDRQSAIIATGVTLYEGALVGWEGGYANHWANGANDVFGGIVLGPGVGISPGAALTGQVSTKPYAEVQIDTSGVTLMHLASVDGTPSQAKVGDVVYADGSDPADMAMASVTSGDEPVGWLSYFRSATDVDVTLFTPSEILAYVGT